MKATLDELPDKLPEIPKEWKCVFAVHFNFGGGKGQSSYAIHDPSGRETPIGYVSGTGGSGFVLPGVKPLLGWNELRKIWPRWMAAAKAKVARKQGELFKGAA